METSREVSCCNGVGLTPNYVEWASTEVQKPVSLKDRMNAAVKYCPVCILGPLRGYFHANRDRVYKQNNCRTFQQFASQQLAKAKLYYPLAEEILDYD